MALPSQVSFGTVVAEFLLAVNDGPDVDLDPDSQPATGFVTFTPSVNSVIANGKIIFLRPITATLNSSGQISVRLVATNDTDINPTNFTYAVTVQLAQVVFPSFNMIVPAGVTVDLASVTPIPASGGVLSPVIAGGDGYDGGSF